MGPVLSLQPVSPGSTRWLITAQGFQQAWFARPLVIICAVDVNTDSSYSRTMDPDLALRSSLGLDVTVALGGSAGLPDQQSSGGSLLSFQHGLRLQPRPWASAQPLVVTETTAIHTDPSCGKITEPEGSQQQPRPDVTVTAGSSAGHQPQPVLAFASSVPVPPFSAAYELFHLGRPVGVLHPPCTNIFDTLPHSGKLRNASLKKKKSRNPASPSHTQRFPLPCLSSTPHPFFSFPFSLSSFLSCLFIKNNLSHFILYALVQRCQSLWNWTYRQL